MKIRIITIGLALLLGVNCMADKPSNQNNEEKHEKKQKNIPYGLQKKVENGKPLPPGWQKKIAKGEVIDTNTLSNAKVVYSKEYPKVEGTKVYELENKVFRVMNATKEILEVFK